MTSIILSICLGTLGFTAGWFNLIKKNNIHEVPFYKRITKIGWVFFISIIILTFATGIISKTGQDELKANIRTLKEGMLAQSKELSKASTSLETTNKLLVEEKDFNKKSQLVKKWISHANEQKSEIKYHSANCIKYAESAKSFPELKNKYTGDFLKLFELLSNSQKHYKSREFLLLRLLSIRTFIDEKIETNSQYNKKHLIAQFSIIHDRIDIIFAETLNDIVNCDATPDDDIYSSCTKQEINEEYIKSWSVYQVDQDLTLCFYFNCDNKEIPKINYGEHLILSAFSPIMPLQIQIQINEVTNEVWCQVKVKVRDTNSDLSHYKATIKRWVRYQILYSNNIKLASGERPPVSG